MENESSTPDPAEAARALEQLGIDDGRLASKIVTPGWYHPVLGLIIAVIVASLAFGLWAFPACIVAMLALVLLTLAYTRRYGVGAPKSSGQRSRTIIAALSALVGVAFVSSLVIGFVPIAPWFAVIPGAVVFVATILLGRSYDDALRREIAGNR